MGLKDIIVKWLGIKPVERPVEITIREATTKEVTTLKNQLWYRGDPVELEQFYQKLAAVSLDGQSMIPTTRFWAATPTDNTLIRKFHSGLPRLIVDKLAAIVVNDMNTPEGDSDVMTRWKDISDETDFQDTLKDAVVRALSEGDGAFKICVDQEISQKPLVEFYSGNNVDFVYKRGKLMEIHFYTDYFKSNKRYRLAEYYGRGFVRYELFDSNEKSIDLATLDETKGLVDVAFDGDFIMGVPLKFYKSAKFPQRGESIFEGKGDTFDALDEVISTWLDAIREGRVKQYIPEGLVPRNEDTGALRKPSVFNNFYIKSTDMSEDADNKIEVIQGDVTYEGLLLSYNSFLDVCLQGLISPSTLGIDVKKLDNAEAQREKEKTTLYTRDTLISVLMKVLPQLVEAALKTEDVLNKRTPGDMYQLTFEWGAYANPSFEALVETVGKAKQFGIMSTEQAIEELYGDDMTEDEKAEEVARIKVEQGIQLQVDEPAVNNDLNTGGKTTPPGDEGTPAVGGEGNGNV